MSTDLPDRYDPNTLEPAVTRRWLDHKAFAATPDARSPRLRPLGQAGG